MLFARRAPSPDAIALVAVGLLVQVACGIAVEFPAWGYRTLLFGIAALALAAAWAARRTKAFDRWVGIASGLAVALAAKAVLVHGDSLAAIPALAVASAAGFWLGLRRERPDWASLAAIGAQLTVATTLWHGFRPQPFDVWAAYLCQLAVSVAAVLMLLERWLRDRGREGPNLFTHLQQAIILFGAIAMFGIPVLRIVLHPEAVATSFALKSGEVGGLGALLVIAAALGSFVRRHAPAFRGDVLGGFALAAGVWLALAAARRWPGWPAYHTLMGVWTAAGAVALSIKGRRAAFWAQKFALLAAGLALRSSWDDPLRPYWPAGGAVLAAAIFAALANRDNRIAAVWASGGLLNLAGLFIWVAWGEGTVPHFLATQSACFAAAAVIWYALNRTLAFDYSEAAQAAAALLMVAIAGCGIAELAEPFSTRVPEAMTWVACGLSIAAALVGLLAPRLRFAPASLYALGLSVVVFGLLQPRLSAESLLRPVAVAFAGFVLIAQFVERTWSFRKSERGNNVVSWFAAAQIGVACAVILLSFPASLGIAPTSERLAGALSLAVLVPAACLLALRAGGSLERGLEHAVFGLVVLALAEVGWAFGDSRSNAPWLHGSVSLLAALGVVAVMAALLAPRILSTDNRWAKASRRAGPVLGALGVVALAVVLLQELFLFQPLAGHTPLDGLEIGLVAAAMLGLMAAALSFAVRPGIDPFGLSGSWRKGYVYSAEIVLALLFLHLRFNGLLPAPVGMRWAFAVMVIAFAGVGLGEFFRRRGLEVLADPLHRTGVFLPALPLIAFWLIPTPEGAPAAFSTYAFLWLMVGALYGALALTRRSYRYVLGSALAMNIALWSLYGHEEIGFLVHPQLWLVPLALIVLASEYYQRDRLTPEIAAGLRYAGLAMLYISSTADIFVAGPRDSAPLLLVLAVLSVIGVLAGILLRVRAYLFLGSGFLTLVVFRMIWHAAVEREQTWVWWACGIVLGILVLILFAILERRGQRVRDALDRFRHWR